jgi:hypothetical protein
MSTSASETPVYAPRPLGEIGVGTREEQPQGETTPQKSRETAPVAEDINTRFFQALIPAAATIASTFGPQIGSALGGLFGGSSGAKTGGQVGSTVGGLLGSLGGGINLGGLFGRSYGVAPVEGELVVDGVPPTVDVTTPMVQQCTLDCLSKLTPDLASMLQGLYPQMPSAEGARSADAEIEAIERFWPDIAAFVTQQVATHLPAVMQKVTSSVLPLLGTRDTAQFTPVLTGTEANARWFLPIVSSVLTTVQQNLPQLLQIIGGTRATRSTAITWTDLANYGRFWDRDFIRVVNQQNLSDQNSVELVLELAPHLSWAKELQVLDDNGVAIGRLRVQDTTKSAEGSFRADQILTNGSLLFAKAKLFGVITGMYVLPTAGLNELRAKRTTIRWMSD